jgi:hypothetical protein
LEGTDAGDTVLTIILNVINFFHMGQHAKQLSEHPTWVFFLSSYHFNKKNKKNRYISFDTLMLQSSNTSANLPTAIYTKIHLDNRQKLFRAMVPLDFLWFCTPTFGVLITLANIVL